MTSSTSTAPQGASGESWTLEDSIAFCRELTRRRARNFYYGMKLLPEPKRSAMYAIYAWMREADDLADEPAPEAQKLERLDAFQKTTRAALRAGAGEAPMPEGPIWPAVQDALRRYNVSLQWLQDMVDGQLLDQRQTRYQTFDQLYDYCYKVASVVGLTSIQVWGYTGGEETRKLAEWRGIAFQLTNILRDVREDAQRNRIYLPAEDFETAVLTPEDLLGKPNPLLLAGVQRTIDRAAAYYEQSAPLDERVDPDGRPCLWAMTEIYRGILNKIMQDPSRIFTDDRVRLSRWRKALITLRAPRMRGGRR